ncbi:MAG: lipid-A-disaccharide synthase [Alphaproteobacteria bacterium]|jgi:lipid-A-disaccharide synthase|nr:lipid-A-disaccharide synthase [Alphaproteobacteria bacterium]OJU57291.1 MAG: lipid-A-disaccharide synthase [Alphaproteobacteria bacterium 62-8]
MTIPEKPISLMLVCGEPSGDQLGGQLMAGLRALAGDSIVISGVGGRAMEAQGLKSLFPLDDTAVMGLREVVPKIPRILGRVRDACDYALATRPDAVVLIDSPDFTHRIARAVKRRDASIATINYVAPQVWASRAYRARAMARYFDLVLALLPFEPPFFESYNLSAVFVGHPVLERAARMTGGAGLRRRLGIAPDAPLLAVLPGSRSNEIRFILPVFREAVRLIAARVPGLVTVLPTVPHVATRVQAATTDWPAPLHVILDEDQKFAAFDAANAALAASGTVTTELALARVPFVSAYRVGWLTYALARPLFKLPHFTLVNLLLKRGAVPEFLQGAASPQSLADAVTPLLTVPEAAARQRNDLDEAMRLLGRGGEPPSLRAAQAILDFVRSRRAG